MDEIREKLKPFVGKRITIRGCLAAFSDWIQNYRDVGRACISLPEMEGEVVADHVWVMGVQHWFQHKEDIGQQVEFTAVVKPYTDSKARGTNYHLTNPDELQVLHGPPALRIPDLPDDEALLIPDDKAGNPEQVQDPLEVLRQVKAFTKAIGGQDQAEKVAIALEAVTIPVPELITWVKALGEE
jgi:hypothetical protein